MDRRAEVLLDRFAAAAADIADEIAEASMREVPAFEAMDDARLREEIRALAAQHVRAFTLAARTGMPPPAEVLAAARERAVMRARQMVPLSAMLHSHLIAQRVISAALTNSADRDAASRGIALELIARTFDYNIAVTSATAEAYLDIVQGDMLDLNAARRAVIDAAVAGATGLPELTRRAAALGFAPDRRCALAVIRLGDTADGIGDVARAIARATGALSEPRSSSFTTRKSSRYSTRTGRAELRSCSTKRSGRLPPEASGLMQASGARSSA